ncbi:MAG: hypothetical protein U9N34_04850, partial [Candidatus Cloacimonadota bacterium]|nr:hypothetical protein [Candidatus Cloacimonadota bacterium]
MKKNILVIIAIITILGCAIQNNSPKSKKSSFKIFSRYGEIKYNEMIEQLQSADVIFFGDYKEDAFLHSLEKKL